MFYAYEAPFGRDCTTGEYPRTAMAYVIHAFATKEEREAWVRRARSICGILCGILPARFVTVHKGEYADRRYVTCNAHRRAKAQGYL